MIHRLYLRLREDFPDLTLVEVRYANGPSVAFVVELLHHSPGVRQRTVVAHPLAVGAEQRELRLLVKLKRNLSQRRGHL